MESRISELEEQIQRMLKEHDEERADLMKRWQDEKDERVRLAADLEAEKEKSKGLLEDLTVALAERDQADAKLEEWDSTEQFRAGQVMLLRKQMMDLTREVEELRATPTARDAETKD
jgi:chromosome segregation ATPase